MQLALDFFRFAEKAADKPRPSPPKPGPVLLGDCITPTGHGTLLLALWQKWEDDRHPDT
jgi:hypothetical protein